MIRCRACHNARVRHDHPRPCGFLPPSGFPTLVALLGALLLCWGCAPASDDPLPEAVASGLETPQPATDAWTRLPRTFEPPADRPLYAGFLIVDGVYNSELIAPYDILHHVGFHAQPGIEVFTVSPDGAPVQTFEGLEIRAHHSFETAPPIDILIVPSAENSMDSDLQNEAMIDWVRRVGEEAKFVLSLCDGAFVLAQAGLLDGHAVTTFPGDLDRFAEMFPHLDLRREISFVHDRQFITSQGGAKSYDPAMYLVDHLYGEQVAQGVGRGMVIPWPPAPGTMPAVLIPRQPPLPLVDTDG